MRKRTVASVVIGMVLGASLSTAASANMTFPWQEDSPFVAKVKCLQMAEDSAAHLRLVKYEPIGDGTLKLVYRCK